MGLRSGKEGKGKVAKIGGRKETAAIVVLPCKRYNGANGYRLCDFLFSLKSGRDEQMKQAATNCTIAFNS